MKIEYLGIPVNFKTEGAGNPLVLLHGFLETIKIWEPFVKDLSLHRQVICVDLPGHGDTGNFGEIHTMELMAGVVNAVLEHLNIFKASFAGHSMGGYVSLAFAEKYPEKILGVLLINSSPEEDSEERKNCRDRAVRLVEKNKKAYENMAISNLAGPGNTIKFKKEIEELKEEAQKMPKEGIIANLRGMKIRTNKIQVLNQLTIKKIMILGEADSILPFEDARNIGILSKCIIIPVTGGHLSYLENYSKILEMMYFID